MVKICSITCSFLFFFPSLPTQEQPEKLTKPITQDTLLLVSPPPVSSCQQSPIRAHLRLSQIKCFHSLACPWISDKYKLLPCYSKLWITTSVCSHPSGLCLLPHINLQEKKGKFINRIIIFTHWCNKVSESIQLHYVEDQRCHWCILISSDFSAAFSCAIRSFTPWSLDPLPQPTDCLTIGFLFPLCKYGAKLEKVGGKKLCYWKITLHQTLE